jgi:pimeloyl-ACP methyl ester carboxylesterase
METVMTKSSLLCVAVCLFFLAACQGVQQRQPAAATVKQMSVNGVHLSYVEQGRGAPLLFVHGSNADHRLWEPQREAFAANYRFIALDQRYFGATPWSDSGARFSQATFIEDLRAFIQGLNAGPVHLIGWSLSGGTLLPLAVQSPELVKSVFVYEPAMATTVTDPADLKSMGDDRRDMAGPAVALVKTGDHAAAVRVFMDSVNGQPGTFDAFPPATRAIMIDNARMLPLLFAAPPPPPVSCAQLGQVKVPVMIARGELTRPAYKIMADTASRCVPGSRLIVVPQARHLWPGQEPAAFNRLVLDFLKGN